jgi:hypothetical protein
VGHYRENSDCVVECHQRCYDRNSDKDARMRGFHSGLGYPWMKKALDVE